MFFSLDFRHIFGLSVRRHCRQYALTLCLFGLLGSVVSCGTDEKTVDQDRSSSATQKNQKDKSTHETFPLRGRVVWLGEAIQRLHQIKSVPEAMQRVLALETKQGQLHPLVEDLRGRSFRKDKRLRDIDLELLVRRHQGSPMIQVIRIYRLKKKGKFELDYWCDICAIAMFEEKACDCCQGPIRLRERLVSEKNTQP